MRSAGVAGGAGRGEQGACGRVRGAVPHLEHVRVRPAAGAGERRRPLGRRLGRLQEGDHRHQVGHDAVPQVDGVATGAEPVVRAPARPHLLRVAAVGDVAALVAVFDGERPAALIEQLVVQAHVLLRAAAAQKAGRGHVGTCHASTWIPGAARGVAGEAATHLSIFTASNPHATVARTSPS